MRTILPVNNNDVLAAVQTFLRQLLESGLVDAIYVPLEVEGGLPIPALVTDPVLLEDANPLAPVMPINGARAISALTGKGTASKAASEASGPRIGAVLRPCEIRALIELVKLQQANLERLVLIGLDCPGTYEGKDYRASLEAGIANLAAYLDGAKEGEKAGFEGLELRPACEMCVQPASENVDIRFELFGASFDKGIPVEMGEEIAEKLGYTDPCPASEDRGAILDRLIENRSQVRERELSAIQGRLAADGSITGLLASCIRCHNCMTVCPICYCKTCLFKTAAFDHPPEHYFKLARQKGATRMLGDTLLFHMTRLNHMSASCVSCGMCTSACPADIPVGAIFSAIGSQVQAAFDYVPGRSVSEPLPLITFQPNEWMEVGESNSQEKREVK